MQYIDPVTKLLLADKLKVGNKRVNVRVEVDKLAFDPSGTTELDLVRFLTESTEPVIVKGSENETAAALMMCPIDGKDFKELVITSRYGTRGNPFGDGGTEFHHGIDIDGETGDIIVAVADGFVKYAGYSSTAGNFCEILHANGIMTRYMHLDKLLVKTADTIKQGQHIGEMGNTGRSTGSHLHFEVRLEATKTSIGDSTDPEPYLKGTSKISNIAEIKAQDGQTGTVNSSSGLLLREEARQTANSIKVIPDGSSVTVLSKVGEWYKVGQGGDIGYVYGKYIALSGGTGGSSTLTRRQQIILAAKTQAAKFPGVDFKFLLAIAQHETEMGTTGAGTEPLNAILGYDVNGQPGHPLPAYQGFDNQLYYGAKRVYDSMKSKSYRVSTIDDVSFFHNGGDMGTAYTWSASGQSWIDGTWASLQQIIANPSNWDVADDVGGETIESVFGSVKGTAVTVKKQPSIVADSVGVYNTGHVFEYYTKVTNDEGEWYRVKVSNTQEGYISAKYFEPNSSPITTDYMLDKVFGDDFQSYGFMSSVEKTYAQNLYQGKPVWMTYTDWIAKQDHLLAYPLENVYGKHYIQFSATVFNAGRLDLKYTMNCVTGNRFNIYVDGKIVLSRSGNVTEWETFSTSLTGGVHTIKIERERNVEGADEIRIDNIGVYQFLYKNSSDSNEVADSETNTVDKKFLVITADQADVFDTPSTIAPTLTTLNRGQSVDFRETTANGGKAKDGFYEVEWNGETGYIREEAAQLMTKQNSTLIVNTGNFVFEKTFVLHNVISVEIDDKYEMRSAEAVITLSNEDGFYSPDYKPNTYSGKPTRPSPFVDYVGSEVVGVLDENTPVRIYLGYGDKPARKFTGLIDSVDMDSESKTITIRCSNMMKKLNNYYNYSELKYPPTDENTAWLVSSVIHDIAMKAGLNSWRVKAEDMAYPDIVVEESYYSDLSPNNGTYVVIENDIPVVKDITSLPIEGGYRNPCLWINKPFEVGSNLGDASDELCQNIGYWQRCDCYGTYWVTPVTFNPVPSYTFRDTENIISVSKTIDHTGAVNHLIISGGGKDEHFFDNELWRAAKGVRKTGGQQVDWANSYGLKKLVATKMFTDMKMRSRTLQVGVEGNPFLELLDTVAIEDMQTATKDNFVVKGVRDSYHVDQGYLTFLDLFWYRS